MKPTEYREVWGCRVVVARGDTIDLMGCRFSVLDSGALVITRYETMDCVPELALPPGGWTLVKTIYVDGKP